MGSSIPDRRNCKGKGLEAGPSLVSRQTSKKATWLGGSEEGTRWKWDQRSRRGSDDICLDKQSGFILNAKGSHWRAFTGVWDNDFSIQHTVGV